MSDAALEALLGTGENQVDLTGVNPVSGDDVLNALTGENPEKEEAEPVEAEVSGSPDEPVVTEADENPNNFLDALKAVDIDADGAYGLNVNMQDENGETVTKTISELKDAYMQAQQTLNERESTATEQATRNAELQQQQDQFLQQRVDLLQMPQQLQEVESKLYAAQQYVNQNREELNRTNPSGLALAEQEIVSLNMQRENLNMATYNLRQQQQDALRNSQSIRDMQHKQRQTEELVKLIPGWADPEVRAGEEAMLIDHLKHNGFTDERIATLTEAVDVKYLLDNARRAKSLSEVKAKSDEPKPLKPQAVKSKTTAERAAYNKLIKQATNSKDPRDKIDGIVALMNQ